jgi:amino-acid N-acetyltransferase
MRDDFPPAPHDRSNRQSDTSAVTEIPQATPVSRSTAADASANYVKWFRNSAPYINAHRGRTFVIMFGGDAVDDPSFATIIHDIALLNSLGVRLVLVHGARPQIEARCALRGITPRFHHDMRITDSETLECVKDAAGSLRAQIEALLSMGLANSPMHGAQIRVCSGNFVVARPLGIHDGIDFCNTGEVRRVDVEGINRQLQQGSIVLLSAIGYSPTGEVFNLAYEDVATQTAVALKADKLIAFSREPGLFDSQGELVRFAELREARPLYQRTGDPLLKGILQALIQSIEHGVKRAHLISYRNDGALLQELFTRDGAGTLITEDQYEQIRTAGIDDVGGILNIIEPLEAKGILVKRSRELLETEINHFMVIDRDGMVIACAALYPYPESGCGEIACVATHADYLGADRGERLLAALERKARQLGLQRVFVLTTRTAHWFQEQGFVQAPLEALPPQKQALYNFQRNSRVFMKSLY